MNTIVEIIQIPWVWLFCAISGIVALEDAPAEDGLVNVDLNYPQSVFA